MKPYFVSFLILFLALARNSSYAQTSVIEKDSIYSLENVEINPTPVKGMSFLFKRLSSKLTAPKDVQKFNGCVKIVISFVVYKNGTTGGYKILKGKGYGLEEIALQTLKELNLDWIPGKNKGKHVKTRMVLPLFIKLD